MQLSSRRFPEKEALVHGEDRLSYRELVDLVAQVGGGLRSAKCGRGDRIGIYLEPSIPQVVSIFGIAQAGGVFVPINHLLLQDQVLHIANDCRMKGLITSVKKYRQIYSEIQERSTLEFLILVGEDENEIPSIPIPTYRFEEMCKPVSKEPWGDVSIENDLAAILYTSGSTGKPKGVMLSHAQIMAGSSIVSTYLEITDKDRILAILPLSFDAGLNQVMTAFQQGCTLILMTFVFAKEIVKKMLNERITGLAGVPTLWNLLAQSSSTLEKNPLPDLRYITNTGGVMPQSVLASLRKNLPTTKIFLMYGLTEAFRSTYLPPEELDRRPGSMGKAIPNTEILVINDQGKPARFGETGELVHRGPTVSMGYWGNPELTAKVLRPHPFSPPGVSAEEKVCFSGDLVKMDEEGYLYFVGRRDSMIKSSGFRISRTEIEEALIQSGGVLEAAVIGVPDEVLGQSIKAFVVAKENTAVNEQDLQLCCAAKLPQYMIPKSVVVLDVLPKTPNGKIDYTDLQRREKQS